MPEEKRVVYDFPQVSRSPCPKGGIISARKYADQLIMLCSMGGPKSDSAQKCGCGIAGFCYSTHSIEKLMKSYHKELQKQGIRYKPRGFRRY